MTITYRDATPDDAALLSALSRESFAETFGHLYDPADLAAFLAHLSPQAWREELLEPGLAARIAEAEGVAAGFAKVSPITLPVTPTGPAIELRQLYVLKPWQGAGVAAALMDWALAQARASGAQEMFLSVYVDNHRAKRFYARYGFEEVGAYQFMVGNHADDDRILRLDLARR